MPTTNRVSAVTPGRMIRGTTRAPRRVAARVDTKASTNVRPLYLRRAGAEEAVTDACSLRELPQCLAPHGCVTLKNPLICPTLIARQSPTRHLYPSGGGCAAAVHCPGRCQNRV